MDRLSSRLMSRADINSAIAKAERRYPSLKADNARIRDVVTTSGAPTGIDVNAALISDCRTDLLTCGRCAFWAAHRERQCHEQ